MSFTFRAAAIAAASLVVATTALAHVTLEQQQATANSTYKAVLRVPHGCEGSPTVRVRVQIPDGMINVKPQPKPGWELTTVRAKYEKPVAGDHGSQITEGVREIAWSGGRLLDEHYDEFVFRGQLPNKPGEVVYVPVVTECEKGVDRWIEIPAAGQNAGSLRFPAPSLRLTPRP
jgi:uncharacterized protein YcnI